ncbi:MAG TPA: M20/M25/M40 family metallo-hydrolase [Gemmatimonadales bacterium]|jgi:acetylornithine deacetylase/succinyl-diaminopimelate desuccinylase-like protein|nr:M20/M25/M40 family metallo-hydrolase [Gemmatimonadales bacterium]
MPWYHRTIPSLVLGASLFALPHSLVAQPAKDPAAKALEREILKQLIEINTSDSAGHTPEAAQAMADRLLAAGFPEADVRVLGYSPRYQSLVARYRGRPGGRKPILLMAHLDVVDARREDWTTDPYQFVEKDGFYYGRGTSDIKDGVALLVANFIRYKKEGFVPDRDLIIVLTADEETTSESIRWLVTEHRELVDAEYALNTDGGGGDYRDGKPIRFNVQAAEKVYQSFALEVRNKGGHSSRPVPDNAIYRLSRGLARLADYQFPVRLNEVTRAFFARGAAAELPAVAADMRLVARTANLAAARRLSASSAYYNSVLHTTCVATRLLAGHADNALPQLARATVNCRIQPDESVDSVEARLRRVVADTAIRFSRVAEAHPSPPSPLRRDVLGPVEALARQYWPGVPVVPEMSTGATDGLYTRNAGIRTYGVAAVFEDMNDSRAHGRDERVGVKEYHMAAEYWYELVKRLAGGKPAS